MVSVMLARSGAESWRSCSSRLAIVAERAVSSLARPASVSVSAIRRRSSESVRRLTNPRATNPSTSIDMVGRVNPMWSPTSDSDAQFISMYEGQGSILRQRHFLGTVLSHLGSKNSEDYWHNV